MTTNNVSVQGTGGIHRARILVVIFAAILVMDAMAAYEVLGVPVPFASYGLTVVGLVVFLARHRLPRLPDLGWLLALVLLAVIVQFGATVTSDIPHMPRRATTPYPLFVGIRYVHLVGFVLVLYYAFVLARRFGTDRVARVLFRVSVVIGTMAIYIYAAQRIGLWEPPRTRMGTGGQDFLSSKVEFTYAFHRALGTFREPSHLAQWLVGPFLIGSSGFERLPLVGVVVLGTALVLTGSLLGLIGVAVGVLALAAGARSFQHRRRVMALLTILAVIVVGLKNLVGVNAAPTLVGRVALLVEQGPTSSNRAPIVEYVASETPPPLGYGLGNANLVLSSWKRSSLIQSHLSLFVNVWFALGGVGVLILSGWLIRLIYRLLRSTVFLTGQREALVRGLLAAVAAWIVFFLGDAEELTVMFGALAGLGLAAAMEPQRPRANEL